MAVDERIVTEAVAGLELKAMKKGSFPPSAFTSPNTLPIITIGFLMVCSAPSFANYPNSKKTQSPS